MPAAGALKSWLVVGLVSRLAVCPFEGMFPTYQTPFLSTSRFDECDSHNILHRKEVGQSREPIACVPNFWAVADLYGLAGGDWPRASSFSDTPTTVYIFLVHDLSKRPRIERMSLTISLKFGTCLIPRQSHDMSALDLTSQVKPRSSNC